LRAIAEFSGNQSRFAKAADALRRHAKIFAGLAHAVQNLFPHTLLFQQG